MAKPRHNPEVRKVKENLRNPPSHHTQRYPLNATNGRKTRQPNPILWNWLNNRLNRNK